MTTWGNQQGGEIVKSLASVLVLVLAAALVLAACSSAEPEVREVVKEVEVIKEVPVEVVKEVEVIKEVIKEVVKTEIVVATPAPSSAAVAADTTMAKDSTGVTFWSDLAASCETRGGHMNLGNRVSEFTNLNPPTINQVIQFSITAG
jgi:hypothetical protein